MWGYIYYLAAVGFVITDLGNLDGVVELCSLYLVLIPLLQVLTFISVYTQLDYENVKAKQCRECLVPLLSWAVAWLAHLASFHFDSLAWSSRLVLLFYQPSRENYCQEWVVDFFARSSPLEAEPIWLS